MADEPARMGRAVIPLAITFVILGQVGADLYLPSFSAMSSELAVAPKYIELSLSLFLLSMAVSQLFYGALSDALGRRRVILPALLLYALGSAVCFFASGIAQLLVGRLLQGFAAGACLVIPRAVARDTCEGKRLAQVSVWLSIAWALVPMIAPVAGGYVQDYLNWQSNFLIIFVLTLACYALAFVFLPETRKGSAAKFSWAEMFASMGVLLRNRWYVGYMIVPAMFFSHSAAYMAASPILYEKQLGLRPEQYGLVIMVTAVFYLVGNLLNTVLLKKHDEEDLVKAGLWLSLFGAFVMLALSSLGPITLWAVAVPFCITYLAAGVVFANCVTLALRPFRDRAGAASALLGCLQILMGCVSSALMAWFSHGTPMPLAIYLAFCMTVAFVAVRWVVAGSTPGAAAAG